MSSPAQPSDFIPIAKTTQLKDGAMIEARAGDREILLARVGKQYYAADNICPHMGARLALGTLQGTVVTCPRHRSKFDLKDGRIIRWTDWTGIKASVSKLFRSPRPLSVHAVKVSGDDILVKL
ncbi:MAG: Rieske 2Fe-2S domain-containing protein [Dehalococcoidales bacterium]|nr:Rieske 2Fe-2S domain-containing protein [Dehalococcoidales bacterium]